VTGPTTSRSSNIKTTASKSVSDYFESDPFGTAFPLSGNLRFKLFLTGVVLPICSISAGLSGASPLLGSPWQSGSFDTYVALFLMYPALLFFTPLFALSMFGLSAVVFRPRWRDRFWVRFAVYSGALLAIQYLVAVIILSSVATLIAGLIAIPVLALITWTIGWLIRHYHRFTIRHLLIATTVTAVALTVIPLASGNVWNLLALPLVLFFIAGPCLCCVTYCRLAVVVGHDRHFKKTHPPSSAAATKNRWFIVEVISITGFWLTTYILAWRSSVEQVMLEYQKLPTTDPNCYVASAAANGHASLVKSVRLSRPSGNAYLNSQMQRLKFLEFAMQTSAPATHYRLRKIYNQVGPTLAAWCSKSILLADATFLALKPLEWLAILIRIGLRIPDRSIERIYTKEDD